MNWKRILRSCLCLIVVCCIILNVSPIRARAFAIESSLALGLAAVAILGAAGVIFAPTSESDIISLGESMRISLYQWGTSAEKLDEVDSFIGSLQLLEFDPDDPDDDDSPHQTQIKLARGILGGIALWIGSLALEGTTHKVPEYSYPSYPIFMPELPEWDLSLYPYFFTTHFRSLTGSVSDFCLFLLDAPVSYYKSSEYVWCLDPRPVDLYPQFTFSKLVWSDESSSWEYSVSDLTVDTSSFYVPHVFYEDYSYRTTKSPMYRVSYANFDIYDLEGNIYCNGDVTNVDYVEVPYYPDALLGDVAPGLADGSLTSDSIELPDTLELGNIIISNDSLVSDLIGTQQALVKQPETYDDYLDRITRPIEDPGSNPDSGSDPEPDPGIGSDNLSDPVGDIAGGVFFNWLEDLLRELADYILGGIASIFVPSEDYLSSKVDALCSNYSFVGSIVSTAGAIRDALGEFDTSPPIIYMELNAAEGSIYWGDRAVALDLRWYARYKPSVDALLSAVMYAFFAWRVFIRLSSIISGTAATFEGGAVDDR